MWLAGEKPVDWAQIQTACERIVDATFAAMDELVALQVQSFILFVLYIQVPRRLVPLG